MLKKLFLSLSFFYVGQLMAQTSIGIGTTTPNSTAVLDMSSTNKGFLVPRMSQSARLAIPSPTNGLLVYDSSAHRLYQFQNGNWRYMLTNAEWVQSSSHNWTYNSTDSVGLGTGFPTERLDVDGNILSVNDLKADNNITSDGAIKAAALVSTGNTITGGDATFTGNTITHGNVNLDDPSATVYLQNNNVKKAFFQLSGNDLRFGTTSTNSTGKLIIRLNAKDAISIDRLANIEMLQDNTNQGNITIGWKLSRVAAPDINMLPVLFGLVPADGGGEGWISPFGLASWSRVSTGKYEITSLFGISPYSTIIATPAFPGTLCMATYVSSGKFRIETFNRTGTPVDCTFTYVVNDPLN